MDSRTSVVVAVDPPYEVRIGPGVLDEVARCARQSGSSSFLLTDERAFELHGALLGELASAPGFTLPRGETAKRLSVVERALEAMATADLDRGALVVAFGGGVTGDIAGLCASLFMRGVGSVQCPTTLLAQVDSSVGGKTGVNLDAGKNLAGTFHQPRAVFADTRVLATLDDEDYRSGLGEVLKAALIEGPGALARLEESASALARRDPQALADTVVGAVATKARIVALDPAESGARRALNLGHTFAHAIEHVAGYGRVSHGAAVAAGIGLALAASRASGILCDDALPARCAALARELGLVTDLATLGLELDPAALWTAMRRDKKGRGGTPRFVLVARAGELALETDLDEKMVTELLHASSRGA